MKNLKKMSKQDSMNEFTDDSVNFEELLTIQGGTDMDLDDCKSKQCTSQAEISCYTAVNG